MILSSVLEQWSSAAAWLTKGRPYQPAAEESDQPPTDTGEAAGLAASQLTITIGLGPGLFDAAGVDRFGWLICGRRSCASSPRSTGRVLILRARGDLCVQACADDPQVASMQYTSSHGWQAAR